MKAVVGLGNPGSQYADTRHNIGFMVVDKLARELGVRAVSFEPNRKFQAEIAKTGDVLLIKPLTYMNRTGEAVRQVVDFFKLEPQDIWIIHDDLDLPIGKIRIREGGASGGHNGVDSVISHLRTDKFIRFRLGIGRGKESTGPNADRQLRHRSVINFVLSRFRMHEAGDLKKLVKHGVAAVRIALTEGVDRAMNRFN
jgi:PTH1 family peptidyl-tRNA hydrolase